MGKKALASIFDGFSFPLQGNFLTLVRYQTTTHGLEVSKAKLEASVAGVLFGSSLLLFSSHT